ncbi:hypothetical protein RA268_28015 [Pseudomonas syringae pv. tagetis]
MVFWCLGLCWCGLRCRWSLLWGWCGFGFLVGCVCCVFVTERELLVVAAG